MKLKGYLYGCISAGTYGLIPLFALPVMNKGIAFDSVLSYRFTCASAALALLMLFRKESFRLKPNEILPLITLGILFALSALCLFRSYNFMPAGIASTILFLYPVFVTLIMTVFFHEKISLITITAITLAFTGISLLYAGGNTGGPLYSSGIVLVLLSALFYAIYLVLMNGSAISLMSGIKVTFYAMTASTLFFLIKTTVNNSLQILPDTESVVNILLLAFIPTIVSCIAMVYSVHYIGSTATAVLGAMEPLTAVCIGICIFGEPFSVSLAAGMAFIILAVTFIVLSRPLTKYIKGLHHIVLTEIVKKKS